MFVDEIKIAIKAGDGGYGKVSFGKMEKSGPDGGNGGDGGNVELITSSDLTLLNVLKSKTFLSAENGGNGGKNKLTGKRGDNLIIKLPFGSLLEDIDSRETFEFNKVGDTFLLCRGGEGGTGNYDLRSSSNTTPMNTIPPTKGQIRNLKINLRFIADYGLIGLPSAGKSSLLNELTNTNVKTAVYHFTTLSPNLGVLPNKKIIADIPGLIEGASEGKGLGIKFLKHIQKVDLLLHCISLESSAPLKDYEIVKKELSKFSEDLINKEEIIVLTKSDLVNKGKLNRMKIMVKKLGKQIIVTSINDKKSINNLLKIL
ncbi:Obg family GTPase CgtA [Patescibacteria group bacterium]